MNCALVQPWCSIGSDGLALAVAGPLRSGHPHPRSFGTFPRVLGVYARGRGLLRLEDAVRKMTSLNAAKIGLIDRGLLRPGQFADMTIFHPTAVIDRSTYLDPFQYSQGIVTVLVNGQIVLEKSAPTWSSPRPAPFDTNCHGDLWIDTVGSERRDRDVVGVAMSSGSGMSLGSVWDVVETEEGSEQETRGHARTCNADLTCNSLALSRFRWIVFGIWRKLLSRRRRKGTIPWDQFHRMLGPDLLPQPVDGTGRLLPSAQMADRNMMRYQFDARVLGVSGSPTTSRRMKSRRTSCASSDRPTRPIACSMLRCCRTDASGK